MYQGQAGQDLFVCRVLKEKRNGHFLEIGTNHPITHNNTYVLESAYQWRGLLVEYDSSFEGLYMLHRPNSIYELNDARKVDYRGILDRQNFPVNIDYLQIDLDVDNRSTLDTLELLNATVFDKYKFATVTFEHDYYTGDHHNTRETSRNIFSSRGYLLVFPDVKVFWEGAHRPFEDWYVHPDLVDMDIVKDLVSRDSLASEDIKNKLYALP